jgi:3-phenylpropionate/trans-cinnamate dioxygenase ferredoxin subunit
LADFAVPAIRSDEIALGGMLAVTLEGREIVICHCEDGTFYAVARRCGHMNAPLEKGTLEGTILTCPLHCARFDVTTGAVLAGPVPAYTGKEPPPPRVQQRLKNEAALMAHIHTEPIATYPVRVEGGWVLVVL